MTSIHLGILALTIAGGAISVANMGAPKTTQAAGLQWINGLDAAKAQAKSSGKPILFLSMFGDLDEDMPCANARTMRAALFPTPEFHALSKDIVLAWEKVRNVPKVTVEIDGQKIVRTVRGNAVFYLCSPDGTVVDIFPGQYTKEDFVPAVRESMKSYLGKAPSEVIAAHKLLGKEAVARAMRATMSKAFVESPTLALFESAEPETQFGGGNPPKAGASEDEILKYRFEVAAAGLQDLSLRPRSARELVKETLGEKEMTPLEKGEAMRKMDSENNMKFVRPVIHLYLGTQDKLPTPFQAREIVLEKILKVPYKDPYWGLEQIEMPGTPVPGK